MLKVSSEPNLSRDAISNAIININDSDLNFYKQKREREKKLYVIEKEHNNIKTELEEIKLMIRTLMERNK